MYIIQVKWAKGWRKLRSQPQFYNVNDAIRYALNFAENPWQVLKNGKVMGEGNGTGAQATYEVRKVDANKVIGLLKADTLMRIHLIDTRNQNKQYRWTNAQGVELKAIRRD